jgi:hypothetical protein
VSINAVYHQRGRTTRRVGTGRTCPKFRNTGDRIQIPAASAVDNVVIPVGTPTRIAGSKDAVLAALFANGAVAVLKFGGFSPHRQSVDTLGDVPLDL